MENFFEKVKFEAERALLREVLLTPKPGLVDMRDNGSHSDMDIYTFMDSILVLGDYFYECVKAGYENDSENYQDIMKVIKPLGIKAEEKMYQVTNNVNTHKGVIFIFGILASAIGSIKREKTRLTINRICNRSGYIATGITGELTKDLENREDLTYGEKQFIKYGTLGIRGEAEFGFPAIKQAYIIYDKAIADGFSHEIATGQSFIELMINLFDSNVVGRGGMSGLNHMRTEALKVKRLGGYKTDKGIEALEAMNKDFIRKNLSPGGCADLCAATSFVYSIINL